MRIHHATSQGRVIKSVRCGHFAQPAEAGSQFVRRARRRAARRTQPSNTIPRPLRSLKPVLNQGSALAFGSVASSRAEAPSTVTRISQSQIKEVPRPSRCSLGCHAMPCRCQVGGVTRVMLPRVSSLVFPCAAAGRPLPPVRPNPSFKRSANGRPPAPGRRYAVHFRRPGAGVLPLSPA